MSRSVISDTTPRLCWIHKAEPAKITPIYNWLCPRCRESQPVKAGRIFKHITGKIYKVVGGEGCFYDRDNQPVPAKFGGRLLLNWAPNWHPYGPMRDMHVRNIQEWIE
jgi:hypothetical protein